MDTSNLSYSVVIPVYNSASSIGMVCRDLIQFFSSKEESFEIILVDDGSRDHSLEVITQLARNDSRIKVLSLFKNFGQINACLTGFRQSQGKVTILMDDDLQNSAGDIEVLIAKISEGYDFVYAVPKNRAASSWRTWGSTLNSWMAEKLIGKPKGVSLSSFLIITRSVLNYVLEYQGPYPYLAGLLFRVSINCTSVEVDFQKRRFGRSNYTLRKLVKLWLNGFTNFSILPLRLATYLGFLLSTFGFLYGSYLLIRKFMGLPAQEGWTSLQASILLFSGAQLLCIGLLGEYVGRLFMLLNKQPQAAVKLKLNC